ncbi:NAD(P)H-dependent oxidoreductase [Phreatobacter oligotrophus]|uniref:NAD(P)H-dependent oxidoreductase n=1 Tax=Phreatobacter oligotrophus TaxID=1122261 RepID=UPI00235320C3|nr:NAD(P)H-dependent oxidoreductase [Phreatobacter oligotrophus]MBX9989374.1 NAD(P)H-dependent oxidoreductase [Phreatobacter oligotrophus]
MRILVLYCHPNPESFGAALHETVVASLRAAGHQVDDCDLYAEDFHPVLSRQERLGYHDLAHNTEPVADYVRRLREAEALVLVFPVWNFGFPALLKGFFDRVFLPGVSFGLVDGRTRGILTHISRIGIVTSYGATRWRAFLMGDPPRRFCTRVLRAVTGFKAPVAYLAHYDMNRSTDASRAAFRARVADIFSRW